MRHYANYVMYNVLEVTDYFNFLHTSYNNPDKVVQMTCTKKLQNLTLDEITEFHKLLGEFIERVKTER